MELHRWPASLPGRALHGAVARQPRATRMATVILIITACLTGAMCTDFRVPLEPTITAPMCERQGQFGLAEWAAEHPAYAIRRWRCEAAGRVGAA